MTFRVIGVQLHGAGGIADRVVVLVDLQRVLSHPLVKLARACRLQRSQLLQHGDRLGDLALLNEDPFERAVRFPVTGRDLDDPTKRRFGLGQAPHVQKHFGESPSGLGVGRRRAELLPQGRDLLL